MSKKSKYLILLAVMVLIDIIVYLYCTSNSLSNSVNPVFHAILFLEIAVYSTLILIELTNKKN